MEILSVFLTLLRYHLQAKKSASNVELLFLSTWTSELSNLPLICDAMTLMWRHYGNLSELRDIWSIINSILQKQKQQATISSRTKSYVYTRHLSLPVRLFHVPEMIFRIAKITRSKSVKHRSGIIWSYLYSLLTCIFSRTSLIWADDLPAMACHDNDLIWQNILGCSISMVNDVSSLNILACFAR